MTPAAGFSRTQALRSVFRRLVILDRTAAGHLPMQSGDRRYTFVPGTYLQTTTDPHVDRLLNRAGLFQWRCQRFTAARGRHHVDRSDRGYRQHLSGRRQPFTAERVRRQARWCSLRAYHRPRKLPGDPASEGSTPTRGAFLVRRRSRLYFVIRTLDCGGAERQLPEFVKGLDETIRATSP